MQASGGIWGSTRLSFLLMQTAVLILAAGRGERLGGTTPKAFVSLAGLPLLVRSIENVLAVQAVDHVQPVLGESDFGLYEALALPADPRLADPVPGGKLRQDSVAAGLAALPEAVRWVGVHDAARCLVTPGEIERVMEAGREQGAAILAIPVRDTIKRAEGRTVVETPDRESCWAAQTPQFFERALLERALEKARAEGQVGTDDSQLVERLGARVELVEGSAENIKITVPADLKWAEALLAEEKG